jgi:hypothetical protein
MRLEPIEKLTIIDALFCFSLVCASTTAGHTTYIEANDNNPKAWSFACLFIWVFQRIIAGTTTRARSVRIVETVAV